MKAKDYELIANALRMLVDSAKAIETITQDQFEFVVNATINKFVRDLQEENPKFNKDKFLQAVNR